MSSYITYSTMVIMNPELWTAWDSRRLIATTTPLGRSAKASETVGYRVTLPFSVPVISTRLMHRWGKSQCRKRCASAIVLQTPKMHLWEALPDQLRSQSESRGGQSVCISIGTFLFPDAWLFTAILEFGVWTLIYIYREIYRYRHIYIYRYLYIYIYWNAFLNSQTWLRESRIEPVTLRQLGQRALNSHGPPTYLRAKQSRCQDIKA